MLVIRLLPKDVAILLDWLLVLNVRPGSPIDASPTSRAFTRSAITGL